MYYIVSKQQADFKSRGKGFGFTMLGRTKTQQSSPAARRNNRRWRHSSPGRVGSGK